MTLHLDTISGRLKAAIQHNQNKECLWAKGESRTYAEFYEKSSRISQVLHDAGVAVGDRVAILSGRSTLLYESIVACVQIGAVYTPLNPRFPPARNKAMLQAADAKAIIADAANASAVAYLAEGRKDELTLLLPEGGETTRNLMLRQIDANAIASAKGDFPEPLVSPADVLYLLFTSGSTGTPKGVPITHGNVAAYLDGIDDLAAVLPSDRLVQLVDVTFDLSAHDMFLAWTKGAALYSVPENAAGLAPRFVSDYDLSGWLSVPSTAALASQMGLLQPSSLPSLRFSFFCGEALADSVAAVWADAAPNSAIYNIYGPTEATIAFSHFRFDPSRQFRPAVVPIGQPLGSQKMAAFGPEMAPVPMGDKGELCLSGSQLTPGYWRMPETTAEKFFEFEDQRWYRTGDLVRESAENGFEYISRVDHQIKIQGFRVELPEIENALRTAAGRELCAVVPLAADSNGITQGVVAFIAGPAGEISPIDKSMRDRLPHYMVPQRYQFLDSLPLNSNGKTDYRALAAMAAEGQPA